MRNSFLLILFFSFTATQAQKLKKEDKELIANLQKHVQYLASDELEGRRTGTKGEQLATAYIINEFKNIGLLPKGTKEFLQPFEINEGKQIGAATKLLINDEELKLNKDYFPLVFSANATIEEMPSIALQEAGMPWFFNLKELIEENKNNPHFNVAGAVINKVKDVQRKGAKALFIYNTSSLPDGLNFNGKDRAETLQIPVVYITKEAAKKYLSDEAATIDINLKTDIGIKSRTGSNVIGLINNGAAHTIIIGAHIDHLGFGEDGNSMIRNVKNEIHNGADDNASGTAAMIELARLLKASKHKNNNYLFIGFSGEELGLIGSKYFTDNPTIDLSSVNYMINLDMVGRLNDSKTITVGGFGTSPNWGVAYKNESKKNKIYTGSLTFKFDSSGTGPSDHTSFYRKDIPVLFYFTGLHTDYHKPTDDFDKLNYNGQMDIVKHIYSLIENQNKEKSKILFTKTREQQTTTAANFSVTLGIMPDYSFSGSGVRVDGVSDNRPAQKAGLKTGDVITQLGDHTVNSVETYMQALSKFKKGDKAKINFTRGTEKLSSTVEF